MIYGLMQTEAIIGNGFYIALTSHAAVM